MLTPLPLRVAVLCSHRAPGLLHLLNADPDRGRTYDIVCCVTSESAFAEEVRVERRGVPMRSHDIRAFYDARKAPLARAPEVRAAFDAKTVDVLNTFSPDLVVLAGYLYLLSDPMLLAFSKRILNLHFADLTLRTPGGEPGFPGIRAVRDALAAGCTETRATVHLVDETVDAGPPLVRSWAFPSL
jgi:folate-dependent phosphoribosylglycinamide formyltransferase PurN